METHRRKNKRFLYTHPRPKTLDHLKNIIDRWKQAPIGLIKEMTPFRETHRAGKKLPPLKNL